jgi:hypothetical protein
MRSISSRRGKTFGLYMGLLFLFSIAAHAGTTPPQQATKCPWLITGHFTYVEHVKSGRLEDTNELKIEIDFGLVQCDPYDQLAIYALDRADFSAKGNAYEDSVYHNGSQKCHAETKTTRGGGGRIDPPDTVRGLPITKAGTPLALESGVCTLIWYIKEKRFTGRFQAPRRMGLVIIKSTDPCARDPIEPITDEYLWACDISGVVIQDAAAKTYRFVLLDTYEVPYRENSELKCTVHVQGELTASPAAWKPRK